MTIATALLIAVGAAFGAPMRFVVDRYLNGSWPRGTLVVNLVGSLVLGSAVGYSLNAATTPTSMLALIGIGFCGALTTFGGFAAQTVDLYSLGRSHAGGSSAAAYMYAIGSLLGCVLVGWLGLLAALQIWPGS